MGKAVNDVSPPAVDAPRRHGRVRQAGGARPSRTSPTGAPRSTREATTIRPGRGATRSRDYHVSIRVAPGQMGDEMLAGRVSLVVDGEVESQALVKAIWTEDAQLTTRINPAVAHYTGQAELAEAIQEGLEARKAGDEATATFKLGRAVQLAAESGNESTDQAAGQGRRRRRRRQRDGAAQAPGRRRRRDGSRHPLDQDGAGRSEHPVSAVCPAGHVSTTSDYCDQCGARIDGAEQAAAPPGSAPRPPAGRSGGPRPAGPRPVQRSPPRRSPAPPAARAGAAPRLARRPPRTW